MKVIRLIQRLKNALATLALTLVAGTLAASPVTSQQARTAAEGFLIRNYPAKNLAAARTQTPRGQSSHAIRKVDTWAKDGKNIGFVTHLEPGGYVLLRADDAVPPVKLHSDSDTFSNLPPQFLEVLEFELAQELVALEQLGKANKKPDPKHHQDWEGLAATAPVAAEPMTASPGVALLTTTWNQTDPYNYYSPTVANAKAGYGGRTPNGCVAVALAQIMRYHKKPVCVLQDYSYYDFDGSCTGYHSISDAGMGNYNWTNMPASLSTNSSLAQKKAVAQLIHHCGVSVDMDFEAGSSGAYSDSIPGALSAYFGYTSDSHEDRFWYFDSAWYSMIAADIDAGRPIYYDMQSDRGGHAVVCDGYRNGNEIHLNLGWGGSANAWYNLNNVVTGTDTWTSHGAIFGIAPPSAPLHHFTWSSIGTRKAGTTFSVTITAKDAANGTASSFNGTANLSISATSGRPTVTPTISGEFVNGVWTGNIAILPGATNIVLTADDGWGHVGSSGAFNVTNGPACNLITINSPVVPAAGASGHTCTVNPSSSVGMVTLYPNCPSWILESVMETGSGNTIVFGDGDTIMVSAEPFSLVFDVEANSSTSARSTSMILQHGTCSHILTLNQAGYTPPVATPTFSQLSGTTFNGSLDVSLSCSTAGAEVWYTTNETDPVQNGAGSTKYLSSIHLTQSTTLRARAYKSGMTASEIAEAYYTQVASLTVQANPVSGGTVAGGGTYAVGSQQQISAAPNAGWQFSQWQDGNTQNPRSVTVSTAGATYTASFGQPPSVTMQPQNMTATVGSTASLNVVATGTGPLSYQWRKNDINLNNGGNISGANSGTLTLSPVQPTDTATYSVVVSNSYGTVTSAGASISVGCSLRISTQPTPTTNTTGSTASFSIAVTGATGNVTYQWRKDGLNLSNGGRISGATFAVLAIAGVQAADAGSYSVVITDGCGSVTSANATLVVPVPPAPFLAWGANGYNQTNVPRGLTNLVALAAGGEHNLVLKADGTVLAWGCNSAGQTNVPAGLRNVLAVAAGWNYSLALKDNGTVVGWGDNSMGQITPPSNLKNVQAIAAGYSHAIALQSDGTVVAWGDGSFGQLNIPYALTNVVAIAAGGYHSLALRADGSVLAWGENSYGQAAVPSGLLNVVSVAAGFYNSYAVRGDGTLVCWGAPWYGLNQTPLLATNIVSVGAGYYHCLALKADGTLITWGNDAAGLASVPSNLKNVVLLAAGAEHSIALTAEGAGVPRMLKPVRNGNRVTMALPTLCRKTYFLEYKDSVRETFWRTLPGQPGNGGVRILTDPSATGQLRFYRLRLQ